MIQFFEVRIKVDAEEPLTPEQVQEKLGYEIDPATATIVTVVEDVQARGMGESLGETAAPKGGENDDA
jgi:hypothetical protein